jgi:hypothetical protein
MTRLREVATMAAEMSVAVGAVAAALEPGGLTKISKSTTGGLEAGVTSLPFECEGAHGGASVSAPNGG